MAQSWKDLSDAGAINPQTETNNGGVRNMKVRRLKYKNVTLDNLYKENLELKDKLTEVEEAKKKVKALLEMQTKKMLDVLDVAQV
jgi:hypothetical protein